MAKVRPIVTKNSVELAKALGINPATTCVWDVQCDLLGKLRRIVAKERFTHNQVARRSGISRSRITSILNGNLIEVSTDLLIRILSSLGYDVKVSVTWPKAAA